MMDMKSQDTEKLIDFLQANRHGERILVASMESMSVGPIIIKTGETAVALGGFMGGDKVLSEEEFVAMVKDGQVRFFLFGGPGGMGMGPPGGGLGSVLGAFGLGGGGPPGGFGGPPGGPPDIGNREIRNWVREHGKVVDVKLWQNQEETPPDPQPGPPGPFGGPRGMRMMRQLYDCRPELGLVTPSTK
jgi:4-amino-4-deoxy-L-arabinose transferase-like glycosyltransferase